MKKLNIKFNKKQYSVYYLQTSEEFVKAVEQLCKSPSPLFGLDLETGKDPNYLENKRAGLDVHLSFIRLCQIYDPATLRVYVFDLTKSKPNISPLRVLFKTSKQFIAHYAIFEIKHLMHLGIKADCHCSMLMAQFYENAMHSPFERDENEDDDNQYTTKIMGGFGLANLCFRYFKQQLPKELQLSNWNELELTNDQICYAATDAIATYDLGKFLYKKIVRFKMVKAYKVYKDMQAVIAEMENTGFKIDVKAHNKLIGEWEKELIKYQQKCKQYFGGINLRSPKQLHEWVQSYYKDKPKVRIEWPKSEKTGLCSFNKMLLEKQKHLTPIQTLLDFKQYSTLLSTFGDSLQKKLNPKTKRVHCSFSLGETRTGRLSSKEPNLQNMPARNNSFRHIFTCEPGNRLVVADFGQIEIRVAGELSKDPQIRGAFKNAVDLHSAIVAQLEGKPIDKVTKAERQLGKAINFGLQFGMGATKLALYAKMSYGVEMSQGDAERAYKAYHTRFKKYSAWCDTQRDLAKKVGCIRTPLGKVRKLEEGETYTKAVNTPVQGGAAEVSFLSLIELHNQLANKPKLQAKIINTVHDEIIVECPAKHAKKVQEILVKSMQTGMLKLFPKAVGLAQLTEAKDGASWSEAK